MAPGMPLDFFHHGHYIVTASFTNEQHAIVSKFIKPADVEWWSETSVSPRCLEVPVSCSSGVQDRSVGQVYLVGYKWDFWSWKDFSWRLR